MWELHTCNNAHVSSFRRLVYPWDELHPPEDNTKKMDSEGCWFDPRLGLRIVF